MSTSASAPARAMARNSLNTLRLPIPRGYVRVLFLSPHGYPIVGTDFELTGGGTTWPEGEISNLGTVLWRLLPLDDDYEVRLSLAGRYAKSPVPWLAEDDDTHEQHLWNLADVLGDANDPHGIQVRLTGMDFPCGAVDGVIGPKTHDALDEFGRSRNFDPEDVSVDHIAYILMIEFGA